MPLLIHHTSFSSYQNLCSVKLPDPHFPAVELCCEFPCSAKKETLLFFLHPKGTLVSATSSDCHSCPSDHRELTMAFLLRLLAPTKCHGECGMPTDLPCSLSSAWQDTPGAGFCLKLGLFQYRVLTLHRAGFWLGHSFFQLFLFVFSFFFKW